LEYLRKFAIWVREYGVIQLHYVEATDAVEAINKMMDVCRRMGAYPGSMHIVKILEVIK
jgi:hypothetical protein